MTSRAKVPSDSVRKPRYLILGKPVTKESGRNVRLPGIGEGVVQLFPVALGLAVFGLLQSYGWVPAAGAGLLVVLLVHPLLRLVIGSFTGWLVNGTPAANASAAVSQKFIRATLVVIVLLGAAVWLLDT
jgi:hypothetical protein